MIKDFLSKHKKMAFLIVFILLIALMVISFEYNKEATIVENAIAFVVTPFQKTGSKIGGFFKDVKTKFTSSEDLEKENRELKKQVENLSEKVNRLELYKNENLKLTELLKMDQKYEELEKIGAQTIAKSTDNWSNNFIIDKGSKAGVSYKMLVLSHEGLLGYVSKVANEYSQVMSILDDRSSISVMNKRTGGVGILNGDVELAKKNRCRIDYISLDAEIVVGDEIVTSHLSGFPAGVYIGQVVDVKNDLNGLTKYAIVEPVAKYKNIDAVLIINKKYIDAQSEVAE